MQEGGSAPAAANTSFGWQVGKTATSTPFFRSRLGATAVATVASAASQIDSTSGPTAGTGSGAATAGDSFCTPNTYKGTFAAGAWTISLAMRASTAGQIGRLRLRVWASINADGTSARELTSSTVVGSTVTLSTTVDQTSTLSWSPGALALADEFLFFQLEWEETTAGSSNSSNGFFRVGASATTTDFVPNITLPAGSDFTASAARLEAIPAFDQISASTNLVASPLTASAPTVPAAAMVTIVAATASNLAAGTPTTPAATMAAIVNAAATSLAAGAPTLGQGAYGRVIAASNLSAGAPTLGQGAYGRVLAATAISAGSPTVPSSAMGVIVAATANALAASAPTVPAAAMGVVVNAVASNLSAGAPVPSASVMTITVPMTASSLAAGAPTLGIPAMAAIVNALASNLSAGAPALPTGTFAQEHALAASNLSAGAPALGAPSLTKIVYDFLGGSITVAGPVIVTPNMAVIVLLSASNLATAPPVEAQGTIKQTHALAANALAGSSPTLASSAVAQTHVLTANSFAAPPPTLGAPTLVEIVPDLVLGSRVLDAGLDALRAEANKVLVLTGTPYSYAEAVSLSVGENAATFGSPAAATGGRKISSAAVTNGTVTGAGVVRRWAAVDTVNSRLLAHGDLSGDQETIMGTAWTLDPIVVVQPWAPP